MNKFLKGLVSGFVAVFAVVVLIYLFLFFLLELGKLESFFNTLMGVSQ